MFTTLIKMCTNGCGADRQRLVKLDLNLRGAETGTEREVLDCTAIYT